MVSKTCRSLIEQGLVYHPVYGSGFSTHVPMSLVALDDMGATERQLNLYYSIATSRLNLRKTQPKDTTFNFTTNVLGRSDLFEDFFHHFTDKLNEVSIEQLLKDVIPVLMEGVGGAAFHPLIRLSYALKSDCRAEIAVSLAYWASEYLKLGNGHQKNNEDLKNIRSRLDAFASDNASLSTITDRIKAVNNTIQKAGTVIQPKELTLENIKTFSLTEFAKNDNFTLLHTVTACHAYTSIAHYCENSERSLRYLWEAILISQLSTGIKYNSTPPKTAVAKMEWPHIIKQAVNSTDDHVIKLVYTCRDENNNTPTNTLYRFVAQRAVNKSS
ncbi:questin oxidase family protein [Fulvivirga sp. M361]|uniref:questin oxidase family protein n=1 Tax=Fulvivirga sp. M361 TaxID=2594266 RepID=UPI00117BCFFA|nr:questin oxidase family protein [Fulvivirga sp. M361]TRX48073.1 questin oxidase family protein [Fulvivirga sp. M361]